MKNAVRLSVLLVVLLVVVYVPLILQQNDFRTDDYYLLALVQEKGVVSPFDGQEYQYFSAFRIVPMLSLALDFALFGSNPLGYYAFNLAVQIALVIVFFLLLRTIFSTLFNHHGTALPFLLALALGLHSDLFYNVLWISNRTEGLLLLFYLAALLFFLRFYLWRRRSDYLLALLFSTLALLSKEQAINLPLLVAVLAFAAARQSDRKWNTRRILWSLLPIVLITAVVLGLRMAYDPGAPFFVSWYSGKKLFSLVGINLIAFHPTLAEPLFSFFVQQKIVAGIVGLLLCGMLLVVFQRSGPANRRLMVVLLLVFVAISFPRVLYHVLPRVNSIQVAFLLVTIGIIVLRFHRHLRIGIVTALLAAHVFGMLVELQEWRRISSNERYTDLLRAEREHGPQDYLLLTWYHDHARYAMHFLRHGRFGIDTSVDRLPLYVDRRYGARPGPEFSIEHADSIMILRMNDPRIVFLHDSSLSTQRGLRIRYSEAAADYGFGRADIEFHGRPSRTMMLVERNYRFEQVSRSMLNHRLE